MAAKDIMATMPVRKTRNQPGSSILFDGTQLPIASSRRCSVVGGLAFALGRLALIHGSRICRESKGSGPASKEAME